MLIPVRVSERYPLIPRLLGLLFHPYVLFLVVALTVWWPDGFNIGPVNDGWVDLVNRRLLPDDFSTRIFGSFFFRALGMHLVHSGFQGWQALLFVPTVLRGALMYEIVKRLFPRQALFAVACGLIALFHPADTVYFWVDAAGIGVAMVFALAAILCGIVHLQTGSRASLLATILFQLTSCFAYTAFLLVILAVPVLVWLLGRLQGRKYLFLNLIRVSAFMVAFIVFQAVLAFGGHGREAVVMDISLSAALAGYAHQAGWFCRTLLAFLRPFGSSYWPIAIIPGLFAYGVAVRAAPVREAEPKPDATQKPWLIPSVVVLGLLALAVIAYLPYAISNLRFGVAREMLGAGIFLYMLLLLPVFYLLLPRLNSRHAGFAMVALLAVLITVTGLTIRKAWVGVYRAEEQVLAAVATLVPSPPTGSVIVVHLNRPMQVNNIQAYTNRRGTFVQALRFMYGDDSLQAGFTDFDQLPFLFDKTGLEVKAPAAINKGLVAPYGKLILVDYLADGSARILDRAWLQQHAPKGTDLSAYAPGGYGSVPGESAIICTMLEKSFRPAYCN